jgi:hypothetical protein
VDLQLVAEARCALRSGSDRFRERVPRLRNEKDVAPARHVAGTAILVDPWQPRELRPHGLGRRRIRDDFVDFRLRSAKLQFALCGALPFAADDRRTSSLVSTSTPPWRSERPWQIVSGISDRLPRNLFQPRG